MLLRLSALAAVVLLALTACTPAESDPEDAQEEAVSIAAPANGACRVLEPADVAKVSDETETVPCGRPHTAETFAIGQFRGELADVEYDDPELGAHVYEDCSRSYMKFTGADQSLALRTVLSWAWFRPSEEAWAAGARWYRCDVVGGTEKSARLVELPKTAEGVLLGIPGDRWMACVKGASVSAVPPVPCTEPHDWRAVTSIVVGGEKDKYPGDRLVEVLSRDYCSASVGAWMHYPIDYEYAYTWFHRAEWETGNRRSICWAGTDT